ncbi:MAG: YifB family Mg chelatase-like AAA ATPase [Chloroflexi bacterium]|nr:YifB family Mg chelatase-like AAA ATPase [Chloroflexota bacterium]
MLSVVKACALEGLDGHIVEVETDFNPRGSIPMFTIVGLPDAGVRESRERVRAAIKNSGLQFPPKVFVVNLSPADLPKQGPVYDLAIAVGVLVSTDQMPAGPTRDAMFIGELSLDGSVRHVKGVLPMAYTAVQNGITTIYCAPEDAPQAALVEGLTVYAVPSLAVLVEHMYGMHLLEATPPTPFSDDDSVPDGIVDFADIKGQEQVKRALEIAAAGSHNLLMTGSPGVGKTLLARAVPGILPALDIEEALDVSRIYSVVDLLSADQPLIRQRPFRAPHHTISQAGLIGGGNPPKPGEITLSHRGVLFLDELPELPQPTLEVLRQPVEDRVVTISRARNSITLPANFILIGARNPCPCGYFGDTLRPCTCSPNMVQRYQSKLSGPLMDRIDIHITVPRVEHEKMMGSDRAEPSSRIRERVSRARQRQSQRFADHPKLQTNSDMTVSEIAEFCPLTKEAQALLDLSVKRMQLSARAYHRVLKLSRTIADLADCDTIEMAHVAEAVQYRPKALTG